MACRGSGRVISNVGGAASTVVCPWCDGGGVRLPEVDAQAQWPAEDAPAGDPPAETSAGETPDSAA